MKDLFRIQAFYRLYIALFASAVARNIMAVGVYIFTYELTHSALSVIIVILFRRTPTVFFGLIAGYLADHFHKRWVMVACELCSAIAVTLILGVQNRQQLWLLYLSYLILSLTVTTSHPCKSAAVSEIVPENLMPTANTFLNSVQNVTMIFGSALGGVLYPIFGFKALILCSVSLLLVSAGLISSIQMLGTSVQNRITESFSQKLLGGWYRIKDMTELKTTFTYDVLTVASFTAYNLMITLYPLNLYHFSSSGVGWFNSIYGLGTLVATIIVAKMALTSSLPAQKVRPFLLLLNGIVFILMSMTSSKFLGMTYFFLSVFLYMMFYLSQENLLLSHAGKNHIGRVYAFDQMVCVFILTIAGLGYGKMGDTYPSSYIGYVAGIFLIGVTLGHEYFLHMRKISYAVKTLGVYLLIIFLGTGCAKLHSASEKLSDTTTIDKLRLNLYAPVIHLDPPKFIDSVSQYVVQQMNRGLVQIDVGGQIKPAIAEKWEISPNQKKYTFSLRKNVKFHHGREVNAQDFVYSFSRVVSPEVESPLASYLEKIKGAKEYKSRKTKHVSGLRAIDRYTLEITLSEPYVPFIRILATPTASVVPKEKVEDQKFNFDKNPIGAGPFMFERSDEKEGKIVLKAFHSYFEGSPTIRTIEFYVLSQQEAYYRFLAKELDYFRIGDYKVAEQLVGKGYKVRRSLQNGLAFIGINHARMPFNDANIRQAMFHALDWKKYQDHVLGFGLEAADQFLPRDLFGRIDTSIHTRFNPEYATELVHKSRYGSKLKNKKLTLIKFDLFKNDDEDIFLRDSWSKVGLPIEIVYLERMEYRRRFHSKDFDLVYVRCNPDIPDPDNLLTLFLSKGSYNYFNYRNPIVDSLIDQGPTVADFTQRNKIYQKISQILYEDVVSIPLYYYDVLQALQPNIKFGDLRYVASEDLYIVTKSSQN